MIIGISGPTGSFKSCFLTRLGLTQKKLFPHKKLFSNYHLKNHNYEKLDIVDIYVNKRELKDLIILATELHTTFDCRVSGSSRNRLESYLLTQTRKKSVDFFYDTQYERFLDFRVSLFVDIRIVMENLWYEDTVEFNGQIYTMKKKHPYLAIANYYDFRLTPQPDPVQKVFDGRPWFNEYDTEETIYPPDDYIKLPKQGN